MMSINTLKGIGLTVGLAAVVTLISWVAAGRDHQGPVTIVNALHTGQRQESPSGNTNNEKLKPAAKMTDRVHVLTRSVHSLETGETGDVPDAVATAQFKIARANSELERVGGAPAWEERRGVGDKSVTSKHRQTLEELQHKLDELRKN